VLAASCYSGLAPNALLDESAVSMSMSYHCALVNLLLLKVAMCAV